MFSRFATPAFALVFSVAALSSIGCAAPVAGTADAPSENVATTEQALDGSSLLDTATQLGQKAGPVISAASFLYGLYQNVPGKLDAMNAKLDGIAGDTAAIKTQVAAIDTKMDEQFQADFLASMGAAENYIAIDMKNQMTTLAQPGNERLANESDWVTITTALNTHLTNTDTANQKVLEYFVPEGVTATKYTAAQWYRIFGYQLRAALVKVALRDAQATLASTYNDRAPSLESAARKQTAIANLVSTVENVTPQLRAIGDLYVAARNGALANAACFDNGTYRNQWYVDPFAGMAYMTFSYQSFRDEGASYTSPQYTTGTTNLSMGGRIDRTNQCEIALEKYRYDIQPKIDAFVKANVDAPIASLQAVPANWAGK